MLCIFSLCFLALTDYSSWTPECPARNPQASGLGTDALGPQFPPGKGVQERFSLRLRRKISYVSEDQLPGPTWA